MTPGHPTDARDCIQNAERSRERGACGRSRCRTCFLWSFAIPLGAPLLVTVLWIGRYAEAHSFADLTLPFLGFGFGFAASVASLAVWISGIFDGTAGNGGVYWFGFWFLVGCAMLGIGALRLISRLSIVNGCA